MSKWEASEFYDNLCNLLDAYNLWSKPVKFFNCDDTALQVDYKLKN